MHDSLEELLVLILLLIDLVAELCVVVMVLIHAVLVSTICELG